MGELDPVSMIFFGPPGIGKTVMLGSAAGDPRVTPMLIIDLEGGMGSIRSRVTRISCDEFFQKPGERTWDPREKSIHAVRAKTWRDVEDIVDLLEHPDDERHIYESVAIDSMTELNYLNVGTIAGLDARKEPSKYDPDIPSLGAYNKSGNQLRRLVRTLRDTDLHVFFTAHDKVVEGDISGIEEIRPSFLGKLSAEIPALVGAVGFMRIQRKEGRNIRTILFQPDTRIKAKDRSEGGVLGEVIENPTLPMILDRLESKER